jgi:hypothetical protein
MFSGNDSQPKVLFDIQEMAMNTRTILIASFVVLAMSAGVPSIAATPAQSQSSGAGMMQQNQDSGQGQSMMQGSGSESGMMGMHSGGMGNDRGMSGDGMMGMMHGGMMGMMNACPMMTGGAGLDRKTAMRMHGEMMRAIGDILIKYSDKMEPAAKQ